MENNQAKLGVTQIFSCNYIEQQQERLLVLVEPAEVKASSYKNLIQVGFRRSGNDIYRPYCPNCNACQSIRIPIAEFKPSKSQKRVINKGKHFTTRIVGELTDKHYKLYEEYINTIHKDGDMYPATEDQFYGFLPAPWMPTLFLEIYHQDQLIAVCVTDNLTESLSALYTFYSPRYSEYSLGTLAILKQIELCQQSDKAFLYLGYQIDACEKMNYKTKFRPYQRLIHGQWQLFND